jgi:hypothetical protein
MTWIGIGSFDLGSCVPMALTAQAGISASVNLVLPEIQAKLAGALEVQAFLALNPPSLTADLEAAVALVAQLEALITLGLPSAALDLSAMLALIAELQVSIGSLTAQLSFALSFGVLLGTPGVYLVRHSGPIGDVFPGGLPGGAGPSQPVEGIGIFATDAGAWTAIQAVFRTAA